MYCYLSIAARNLSGGVAAPTPPFRIALAGVHLESLFAAPAPALSTRFLRKNAFATRSCETPG